MCARRIDAVHAKSPRWTPRTQEDNPSLRSPSRREMLALHAGTDLAVHSKNPSHVFRDLPMQAVVTDHVSRNDNSGGYGALALLIERNPLPSLLFDPQWLNVLAANGAARDLYGYDAAEWLRLTMTDIVCDDDLPAFLRSIEPKVRD